MSFDIKSWLRKTYWLSLTNEEKKARIIDLHQKRVKLLIESKKRRSKASGRKKTKKKKDVFKDPALNALFNEMPADLQKFLTSKKSNAVVPAKKA